MRRRWWFLPSLVAGIYLGVVLAVVGASYGSEMSKIHRDVYTDTFHPMIIGQAVTLPLSATGLGSVPSYTTDFDAPKYRAVVRESAVVLIRIGLLQALALFLLVGALRSPMRRPPEGLSPGSDG